MIILVEDLTVYLYDVKQDKTIFEICCYDQRRVDQDRASGGDGLFLSRCGGFFIFTT